MAGTVPAAIPPATAACRSTTRGGGGACQLGPENRLGGGSERAACVNTQWTILEPYIHGFCVNDIANETQAQVDANYGANLEPLVQVKNTCDPRNLFRLSATVRPTT